LQFYESENISDTDIEELKKTGFSLFADLFGRKFWKLLEINFYWAILLSPIYILICVRDMPFGYTLKLVIFLISLLASLILFGPTTAALTRINRNFVIEKHTYVFSDFFSAFKNNFKKSIPIGLLDCVILLSVGSGIYIYPRIAGVTYGFMLSSVSITAGLIWLMMDFYIYPMLVATEIKLKDIIKNAFVLTCLKLKKNLLTALIVISVIIAMLLLIYIKFIFSIFILICPMGFLSFIICFRSYPVIQRYVIDPFYKNQGKSNPEKLDLDDYENLPDEFE